MNKEQLNLNYPFIEQIHLLFVFAILNYSPFKTLEITSLISFFIFRYFFYFLNAFKCFYML